MGHLNNTYVLIACKKIQRIFVFKEFNLNFPNLLLGNVHDIIALAFSAKNNTHSSLLHFFETLKKDSDFVE